VETRGPTLEELAKIFDGDEAEVAHVDIDDMHKDITQVEQREGGNEKAKDSVV